MSSIDVPQWPHYNNAPSPKSHDELTMNPLDGETQTLPVSQQAPLDVTDLAHPGPLLSPPDLFIHPSSSPPGWKRLINTPLAIHERTSLITAIFSNRDGVETTRHVGGGDAQAFIDMIYEVRSYPLTSPKSDPTDFVRLSLIRHWVAPTTRQESGVCAFYAKYVAANLIPKPLVVVVPMAELESR